ncbi:MAG TPA: hypothetical protein VGK34_03645 [Armatimonadota bacterium]
MYLAYIDPGTGSQLVASGGAAIWAIIATGLGIVGVFFKRIVSFFKKK